MPPNTPISPRIALRIVAGRLERLPRAFVEQPLLRIEQLGFARRVAEEAGVEVLDVVQDRPRLHVARIGQQPGIDARAAAPRR